MTRTWYLVATLLALGCSSNNPADDGAGDAAADAPARDVTTPDRGPPPEATVKLDAAQPGGSLWVRQGRYVGTMEAVDLAVDAQGNIYVVGYFDDKVDFGGGWITNTDGHSDVFVASYGSDGHRRWSRRFGSNSDDAAHAVAVDGAGNVYVAGKTRGSLSFGNDTLTNHGSRDAFLVSYTSGGVPRWSRSFGGAGFDAARAVGTDPAGNVYLAGTFDSNPADFGGAPLGDATKKYQIFVASYTSAGAHRWSQGHGGMLDNELTDLAVDSSGNVNVVGHFDGAIDLGGGYINTNGLFDLFVASYGSLGNHRWSAAHTADGDITPWAVATDASDNVYVGGDFTFTASFGGASLVNAGGHDGFLASYTPTGAHRWSMGIGGSGWDTVRGLAVYGGKLCAAGFFDSTISLDGSSFSSAGSRDIFVASFEPASGTQRWARAYGGAAFDAPVAAAAGPHGNVHVFGIFNDTVDFGGTTLTNDAWWATFLLKLVP